MGCFPCKEYKVQSKCMWQTASNWNTHDFLQTSMKVSINKYLRELIRWLKCHISISWDSEKNKNVDQHLLWVLCWKVQPANHPLHLPIILAALGWPRRTAPSHEMLGLQNYDSRVFSGIAQLRSRGTALPYFFLPRHLSTVLSARDLLLPRKTPLKKHCFPTW